MLTVAIMLLATLLIAGCTSKASQAQKNASALKSETTSSISSSKSTTSNISSNATSETDNTSNTVSGGNITQEDLDKLKKSIEDLEIEDLGGLTG
jgi:guanyl-specific ribonuclease Sa